MNISKKHCVILWEVFRGSEVTGSSYALRSDSMLFTKHTFEGKTSGWRQDRAWPITQSQEKLQALLTDGFKLISEIALQGEVIITEETAHKPLPENAPQQKITLCSELLFNHPNPKGTDMFTAEELKALSTSDLVAAYTRLTGKIIKRFATRAKGEAQVLKAQNKTEPPAPKAKAKTRKVNGAAGVPSVGRPVKDFNVRIMSETNAESKPNSTSLRRQLLDWLEKKDGKTATLSAIEKHFDRNMRGVIGKLEEKKWLKRSAIAE